MPSDEVVRASRIVELSSHESMVFEPDRSILEMRSGFTLKRPVFAMSSSRGVEVCALIGDGTAKVYFVRSGLLNSSVACSELGFFTYSIRSHSVLAAWRAL